MSDIIKENSEKIVTFTVKGIPEENFQEIIDEIVVEIELMGLGVLVRTIDVGEIPKKKAEKIIKQGMNRLPLHDKEPTEEEIKTRMHETNRTHNYYNVREEMRIENYGPVPNGFQTWGDYWKSY